MDRLIRVDELVNNNDKYIIIDLRSPIEYEDGTINNSINIPLLDNEARKIIGTIYKQNQEEAHKKGLIIGSKRLPIIYDEVNKLRTKNPNKEIVFFCHRGGTRSKSVHSMLDLMKMSSYRLDGGYKAYRKYILDKIDDYLDKIDWIVLTGNTGTGKTLILIELRNQNYPVINLEQLANNRGSIFWSIGLNNPVTQKNFEDKFFYELHYYFNNNIKNIFIESESRRIGNILLPSKMYYKMKSCPHILLNVSIEKRIKIISDIYNPSTINKNYIIKLICHNEYFKEALGNNWVNEMVNNIKHNKYEEFIRKMLIDYYDKMYFKSHINYKYDLIVNSDIQSESVEMLKKHYNKIKTH